MIEIVVKYPAKKEFLYEINKSYDIEFDSSKCTLIDLSQYKVISDEIKSYLKYFNNKKIKMVYMGKFSGRSDIGIFVINFTKESRENKINDIIDANSIN